jgi:iron complex outermembrane receptor protein
MSRRVDVMIRSVLATGWVLGAAAAGAADAPNGSTNTVASTTTAQQTTPEQPSTASGAPLEEVVVTGTHVQVSTFNSPTPITTIDSSTMQNLGITSVNDAVDLIPQNSNFTSAANVGLGNFNIGAQFANLRGLNPFFGTRTLTLVDGERFVPTSSGGAVDLNVVPSLLISRIDVVTGGASAAYGTDAVAGVVNIILDTKFEGFKLQLDGGETQYDDGGDMHAGVAWGKGFADGKIHEVAGAEYEDAQGIGNCGEVRPWCAQGYSEFTNGGYLTNGLPHYLIAPGGTSFQPTTGMLDSLSPAGYLGQFNNAGTALTPFNPGMYGTGLPFTATQDGAGPNTYDGVTIRPPVIHWSLYSHTEADITDTIQANLDLSFAQRRATNTQASDGTGAPANLIFPNNAYLTPSVAAAMGGAPAFLYEDTANDLSLVNSTTNNAGRVVFSLKGDLAGSWKWDGYYEWGENGTSERLANDLVEYLGVPTAIGGPPAPAGTYDFLNWALNAVDNPATGKIQCAATIPGNPAYNPLAAGCVPLNLFGANNASAAGLAYAYRTLQENSAFTQQVVSGSTNGELFSGIGAGPWEAAVGAEYRHEMASVTHDMANQPWYDEYELSYGNDYTGTIDVVEGFGEINAPLLKDLPLAKNLSVDLAVRETENKNDETDTGESEKFNFPTWKFSVLYDPTDWLRFRADRSRDTRAPSFYELWAQTVDDGGLFGTVPNPWKNPPGSAAYGTSTDAARVVGGGYDPAVGLRPEVSTTSTVGFVITPTGALEGLKLSADWYDITIADAIAEIGSTIGGAGTIVNSCYAGYSYYCQFIQGTPNGTGGFSQITGVENYNLNLGSYTVRGYDFETDYRLPFSRFASGRGDSLDFRILATYQYDQIVSPGEGVPAYNYAGQTGPTGAFGDFNTVPKWQGNAFITYANGPFTGVIQIRYVGSGTYGVVDSGTGLPLIGPGQPGYSTTYAASINNNTVASATYMNLALNYTLPFFNTNGRSLQVFGTLQNVFNKWPPVAPGGNGYPTNPVYFDTYGRTWRAGVRLQL